MNNMARNAAKHMQSDTFNFAMSLAESGISIIPISANGTKQPDFDCLPRGEDGKPTWAPFQRRIAEPEILRTWYGNGHSRGIAAIGGVVSSNLEDLDIDAPELVGDWRELVMQHEGGADLLQKLVIVATPSGGFAYIYRCSVAVEGNQKLACRSGDTQKGEPKVVTLFETRGEGGYFLLPGSPPSCHETGKPYALKQGSLTQLPVITPEEREILLNCARAFDDMPAKRDCIGGPASRAGNRPGDEYNGRVTWDDVLAGHGWKKVYCRGEITYWRRPGKNIGVSATTNWKGLDRLKVFSTSTEFDMDTTYNKFAAFAVLSHNGDFKAAARDLGRKGFGKRRTDHSAEQALSNLTNSSTSSSTPEERHLTDLGNARRLVSTYGRDIRFVSAWGWMAWDSRRWISDGTGQISRLAQKTVLSMYQDAMALTDPEKRTALIRHASKSESASRIQGMIRLAQSQNEVVEISKNFDRSPLLLNTENMTLDLAANEFREHRREDLITKLAPVSVEATAKCQTFLAFLDRILAGNRALAEFLQTFFGYCLSGSVSEQVLVILYGLGANGKTTLIKAITAILGDYALTTPVTTLLQRKNETIPNDIARLAGARLVIAHEVEGGKRLAESLVKTLTGGDNITGRFLHQEYFEFQPTFKVLLVTNHKPVIRGTDHAIWRRIRLVPFTVTISPEEQDHALGEKLIAENSGILNWMLDGFAKWQKHGLGNPADIASATEGYRQEMDSLGDWIEACCHAQPDAEATAKDLFASYASYLGDAREQPLSKRIFGMKLSERGFVSTRSKQERIWRGISLVTR